MKPNQHTIKEGQIWIKKENNNFCSELSCHYMTCTAVKIISIAIKSEDRIIGKIRDDNGVWYYNLQYKDLTHYIGDDDDNIFGLKFSALMLNRILDNNEDILIDLKKKDYEKNLLPVDRY